VANKKPLTAKAVKSLTHEEAKRRNIPTAEYESVVDPNDKSPIRTAYERRNRDLDPQLLWRGKDEQEGSELVIHAPPLYIQEKVHPKALIDELLRDTRERAHEAGETMPNLFADFNGLPKGVDRTEFYRHDQNWSNRIILGDSLQVMASLAEREGLRGEVQSIYIDPPYGIRFNSNFQWSVSDKTGTSTESTNKITREPEQVKAFRDTWRDGLHSYLSYLSDRLIVARDLLNESGSIFIQIGDQNVHLVRCLLDEVFGSSNFCGQITFRKKTMPMGAVRLEQMADFILWYAKSINHVKYRQLFLKKSTQGDVNYRWCEDEFRNRFEMSKDQVYDHKKLPENASVYHLKSLEPSGLMNSGKFSFKFHGHSYTAPKNGWATPPEGMRRLDRANRIDRLGDALRYVLYEKDYPITTLTSPWNDLSWSGFSESKVYVVQTNSQVIKRCILMTSDPGDLVLDPTCGSGTTATVAEQWGRRWITIDTSRVALALARARIMGARYPLFILADSREGQLKEAEVMRSVPKSHPTRGDIRYGFVYERMPHVTLGSIANNLEIDVIWDKWQQVLEPLRDSLNASLSTRWHEWDIPREADANWPAATKADLARWWKLRTELQLELDGSIAAKAEVEYLCDKPYEDKNRCASQARSRLRVLVRIVSLAWMRMIEPLILLFKPTLKRRSSKLFLII